MILTLENSSSIQIADIANENIKIRYAFCEVPASQHAQLIQSYRSFDFLWLVPLPRGRNIGFGHCYDKNVNCKT